MTLTLLFESFAYRDGIPLDADWVLDARMLPNPHYDPQLRPFTGREDQVMQFLGRDPAVERWLEDVRGLLSRWLPEIVRENRSSVTVAIGCTGGRHRSVYLAERLAEHFRNDWSVLVRHRGLAPGTGCAVTEMPLFPLNTVLFPGGRLPLRIFEQRYMGMAKACLRDSTPFGVCLIREGKEVGSPATPVEIGCLARIAAWDMPQLGVLQISALGEQRFRLLGRRVQADGLAVGSIELLPEDEDAAVPESCAGCVKLLQRVMEQQAGPIRAAAPPRFRLLGERAPRRDPAAALAREAGAARAARRAPPDSSA